MEYQSTILWDVSKEIIIYFLVYINLDIVGVFCIFYFKYI